ncbi:MAG: hypothetical protein WCW68_00085 [Methanothrix sp.]
MFKDVLSRCDTARHEAQNAEEELEEDLQLLEDSLFEVLDFLDMGLIQKSKDSLEKIIKSWQPAERLR